MSGTTEPIKRAIEELLPSANSASNDNMADVIGNKTDSHSGDSLYSKAEIVSDHIHSASNCYPTLAAGVTVTGAAGAWTLGNFAEIVPINTITDPFDIHYITVEGVSDGDIFEIILYAATVEIGRVRASFIDVANSQTLPSVPFQCGIQLANTQIQAKVASGSGGSESIVISIHYHIY